MSTKNVAISIDDTDVETTIKRIKKKEFKTVMIKLAEKGDEIVKLFDKPDILSSLPALIEKNIDFICNELILPFVAVTGEQLDEMDVVDVIQLGRELLEYNCINADKFINFLKPDPATKQKMTEALNFSGTSIPLQK